MKPLTIVIHPHHAPGLPAAVSRQFGGEVVSPTNDAGVIAALRREPSALVTFVWDDRFLVPGLRWVQMMSAGVDHVPVAALHDADVAVTSARGAQSPAVADHAVALLAALLRGIGPAVRRSTRHRWSAEPAYELSDRTVGIIGLGSIGEAIAHRLGGLGMSVIGCKRDPRSHSGAVTDVRGVDDLLSVFRDSDAVVLALPADDSTAGLVGREEIRELGPGWIVNVGRGSALDEEALLEALDAGELRGAALDVTEIEPLPDDSPLWDRPDVILTPHMAWSSDRLAERLADLVAANIAAFERSGPWINRID